VLAFDELIMSYPAGSVRIITEYFYPGEVSTAQLIIEVAAGLMNGFDTSVLTAYSNYHETYIETDPSADSVRRGVDVSRVWLIWFHKERLPLRALN
jgi:hypothetical protein